MGRSSQLALSAMAFRIKRSHVALVIACVTACSMAQEHGAPIQDAAQLSESAPASTGEFLQLDAAKTAVKKVASKSKPQKLKTVAPTGVAKVPTGTFPTEMLKKKAARIEREYLARKKVIADKKEAKWQKQVLKVKVDRLATKIIRKNKKKIVKNLKRAKKVRDTRKKAYKSKLKAKKEKKKAQGLVKTRTYTIERREKADVAIKSGKKMIAKIKDEKGKEAHRDKKTAYAMLAKLRIAGAHADGTIIGLTKRQRTRPCLVSLHAAVKLAAGDPTKKNLADAKRQLKKVAECEKQERKNKIRIAKAKVRKEKATKKRREKASKEVAKKVKEAGSKKGMEKAGKKKERWSEVEMPTKKRKEMAIKKIQNEKRSKWL